ncbi:MAG: NAD(P)/FAD-dependent oxidoreductase [Bacteroidetes bacterium]|nr:NAD(P)/FAD-dependent oxidoreductase [Bacteroidota bacterium]
MTYDVIIIGAGLGGLTAGAKLSKEGKKVLLVEQHTLPGGCATTFKRKDYLFEVGLHEMDGLHQRDLKTKIFRDLGVFDHVEFLRVPEFYRFVYKDYDITIPHDVEEAKAVLYTNFPDEKEGIDAYFHQLLNAREIIKNSKEEKEQNLGEFLDSIIRNEDLKLALLGNLGYFHDDPYTLSLSYYSVAQGSYYAGGGNFIKGGSQKLSDYLVEFIRGNGGEVILNHLVKEIIIENDKAVGISFENNRTNEVYSAHGEHIISNASIPYVANKLLPKKQSEMLVEGISKREIGASLLSIYFAFKKPLKEIGYNYYSTFIYDDSIEKMADIISNNKGDFEKRSFTFVDYGQIDSALAPAGKGVGVICSIDYVSDWNKLSAEDYQIQKEKVAQTFIAKIEKLIPGFVDCIDFYEVATAKTVERYTLNAGGAVYGFAQTPERVKLEPLRTIENLYFASAWTKVGGGFSGAIFNGYLTAYEIIRKR